MKVNNDSSGHSELWIALQKLAQGLGVQREDLTEALSGELAELQRCWSVNLKNGAIATRTTVFGHLRAHIERLAPPPRGPRSELSQSDHERRYRACISISFNILDHPDLLNADISTRRDWLARPARGKMRASVSTSQRYLSHALDQIEAQIRQLDEARHEHPAPAVSQVRDTGDQTLIARDAYRTGVRGLVSEGKRIISIYGEPGTGKSTLAEMVAYELAEAKPVVVLHPSNRTILNGDVLKALLLVGLSPEQWTETACMVALQEQLARQNGIGAVVVDDVTEDDETLVWQQLIPQQPATPVLLTSRTRLQRASTQQAQRLAEVELGEFSNEEARVVLATELPDSSDHERAELVTSLGNRPLMLFHAARFLSNAASVSVSDLTQALTENVSETLSLIEPALARVPKLVDLYRLMFNELGADKAASDVLRAFISSTGADAIIGPSLFTFAARTLSPGPMAKLRTEAGLATLQRWGLLRNSDAHGPGSWSMHQLTWRIFRELMDEASGATSVTFFEALASNEATKRDAQLLAPGISMARRLYQIRCATAELLPGWNWLLCLDEHTWVASRTQETMEKSHTQGYVRYDILPKGVRRFDYTTGESSWITLEEGKDLYRLVKMYSLLSRVTDDDWQSDPDPQSYGIELLRAYLEAETPDPGTLRSIVAMGNGEPAFFYKNTSRFRNLIADMSVYLQG